VRSFSRNISIILEPWGIKLTDPIALPIAVIGAGPVGLAAAAHLAQRKLPFVVLERHGSGLCHARLGPCHNLLAVAL
jgi:ribulose 1,5-bisphosphate synthetase/thiazole synthase